MRVLMSIASILGAILIHDPAFASERVEQMRRVVDGLNSADPVIRFATLEEAIEGQDANLRNLAITTALSSDDGLLRSTALQGVFKGKRSFVAKVAPVEGETNHANFANAIIGNRIEVIIKDFNSANGSFKSRSAYSAKSQEDYIWHEGVFDGERVSFMVDMDAISHGGYDGPCRGSAEAIKGQTSLTGKIACEQGSYDIEVDILN